jgi:ElaB/YqjD/DUF883 family membrane-anchored ribosome-binding protein
MSWNPISKATDAIVGVGQTFAEGVGNAAGLVLTPDAVIETIRNDFKFPIPGLPSGGINTLGISNPFEFIKNFIEGLAKVIKNLADNVLNKLDAVVTGGIAKAKDAALTTIRAFGDTADRIISKATDSFSNLLNQAMQSLKNILDSIFENVKQIIGDVNDYVKDRIYQVGNIIAESLDRVRDIVSDFTPANINDKLVQPALEKIGKLQEQLFDDINELLDKIFEKTEQFVRTKKFEKDMKEIPWSTIGRATLKELKFKLSDLKLSRSALFSFWETYFKNLALVDTNITREENCAISDDLRNKASLMRFLDLEESRSPNDFLATKWLEYSIKYNTQYEYAGLNVTLIPGNAPSFLAKKLEEILDRHKPTFIQRILPI